MTNEPVQNGAVVANGDVPNANSLPEADQNRKPTKRNPLLQFVVNIFWFFKTILVVLAMSTLGAFRAITPARFLKHKSVKDETVLVTGAGSGMGRVFAERFAKLGAKLVLWDVNQKNNEETAKLCQEAGAASVHTYTVDVSRKNDVYKAADKVKDKVGAVDILVNNAGIVTGKHLLNCSDEAIEKTMAVNCNAHFWTTKAFLGSMLEQNKGHLVQIVSAAGAFGVEGLTDYCASKFAAFGFSESLAAELYMRKDSDVKVTIVCPTYVDTGMFDGSEIDSPTLLPMLKPEYVVDKAMDAILTNTEMLFLPRFVYVMYFCKGLLPIKALLYIGKELGVINSMQHFKGRQTNGEKKSPFKLNINFKRD